MAALQLKLQDVQVPLPSCTYKRVCDTMAGQHEMYIEVNCMLHISAHQLSGGFTGNEGFMTRSATSLCNMNKPN